MRYLVTAGGWCCWRMAGAPPLKEVEVWDGEGGEGGALSLSVEQCFVGTTAGQVWDAGVVLLRYLATPPMAAMIAEQHPQMVELGSGASIAARGDMNGVFFVVLLSLTLI